MQESSHTPPHETKAAQDLVFNFMLQFVTHKFIPSTNAVSKML